MIEQRQGSGAESESDQARRTRRRRGGIAAFLVGLVGALALFAFFPGLPHVIDWGAIVVSVLVGALARWGCEYWMGRSGGEGR